MILRPLSEWESKRLLGPGLPTAREARTTSAAQARAFAEDIGAAVVAKASGVAHKSDAGLVRLGLGPEDAAACWAGLAAAGDGTVLVAEQVRGELELIVGGSRDPSFGALVTVGLGGVATEVFDDAVVLLAPPEEGELDRALDGLKGARLLNGYRGAPPVDRAGLALIVDLVAALLEADPDVVEIDCNPVLVRDGRPTVLDALVVKR
ncbi:acetate--CoA ligase family protein [Nonomuraea sp. H19]|uniref:acetate--CoA ligase family protein n=1 Tax=Nonomuraea sp. H19 TaxID=3452206 RepID=UPI003F8A36F9